MQNRALLHSCVFVFVFVFVLVFVKTIAGCGVHSTDMFDAFNGAGMHLDEYFLKTGPLQLLAKKYVNTVKLEEI